MTLNYPETHFNEDDANFEYSLEDFSSWINSKIDEIKNAKSSEYRNNRQILEQTSNSSTMEAKYKNEVLHIDFRHILNYFKSKHSESILSLLFDIFVDTWLELAIKNQSLPELKFEDVFLQFRNSGLKHISIKSLDRISGELQWNRLQKDKISVSFSKEYFDSLSKNVKKEYLEQAWILYKLLKIKNS
ncbi:hypothetical protein NEF87_004419 [Candidatus Lokiarchaeum ossiferum]|uniref:Uncharacterized protein n=1 Tax=Candidatus Lokiarchaeum ossiferum TaxID=2951803 RepID=A0ABY6I0A2_9ARCH|nr:hypothetical protein NEF87_004419 [Candidatus Lokiarchaeum sp. B-35]